MTSITLNNVRKEFGDIVAVDDLDLEIEDGEFITFVGPSGCGKTTSLRLIAGLEHPNDGQILFDDDDVTELRPSRRNVGMVFQNLALYPHMTVRENMEFGMSVGKVEKAEQQRRIEEVARMLDISELLDRSPSQLSGGQQQRVAIGRTLVLEPDVFLLDEPLASLDAKLRVEIRQELQQLQEKVGITTIYVTHDQQQAMTMSDRIAVMNGGRLQQFATPEEVYHEPANDFVAHFIGTPSMNLYESTVSKQNGHLVVDTGFTEVRLDGAAVDLTDSTVRLGIRPEHIEVGERHDNSFDSTVEFVEYSGADKIVHFRTNETEITGVLPENQEVESGNTYPVTFGPDRVFLFDSKAGERLY